MITYGKDELEALVHAIARHWGGQPRDWRLVVEPPRHGDSPGVALHVEIALGHFTRVTTIPLSKPNDDRRAAAPATARQAAVRNMSTGALAAVRRTAVQSLLVQSGVDNIEPLLGYLRCCGILVMD